MIYRIRWDNGHATGLLYETFTSRRAAEQAARHWKREMVAIEPEPLRAEARRIYQWEIEKEQGAT